MLNKTTQFVDAEVWPEGSLEVLSQFEVDQLRNGGAGGLYPLLRRCMLAVLHADSQSDDARTLLETYKDFPSLQTPASYNLDQVIEAMKASKHISHAGH